MNVYEDENIYRIFFTEYGDYQDMESLFEKFNHKINAVIHKKIDGPYSRIWVISIHNCEYKLVVDEAYGSSIVAESDISKEKLKLLTPLIEEFIN